MIYFSKKWNIYLIKNDMEILDIKYFLFLYDRFIFLFFGKNEGADDEKWRFSDSSSQFLDAVYFRKIKNHKLIHYSDFCSFCTYNILNDFRVKSIQ